jgi:hypothetical protein
VFGSERAPVSRLILSAEKMTSAEQSQTFAIENSAAKVSNLGNISANKALDDI